MDKWLLKLETVGNKIPHPMALFLWLCLATILLSALGDGFDWQALHPANDAVVQVNSLMSAEGVAFILTSMVSNFTGFAPVGPVIFITLAFALAEYSGLLSRLIRGITRAAPQSIIAPILAFVGVMSSIAFDSGYVVFLPLCAAIFLAYGRHPIAGLVLGFACVSGGYSANLVVGPVDVVLSSISTEALRIVDDTAEVGVLANYYFMIASTLLVISIAVVVNNRVIEPYLNERFPFHCDNSLGNQTLVDQPTSTQPSQMSFSQEDRVIQDRRNGSTLALVVTTFVILGCWLWLTVPVDAPLRNKETGGLLKSPFMTSIVSLIALSVTLLSTVYGISNKSFSTWEHWVEALEKGIKALAPYLVLMFVVAQFVAWFKWTDLGALMAIKLAATLQWLDLPVPMALLSMLLITAMLNLFIGSASAKWALLAPILIPAFYLAGVPPESVQAAYRIADSSTNIITPLMPYFPLVLAFAHKYQPNMGIGRLLAIMLPYSLSFLIAWSVLLTLWITFSVPLGL